MTFKIKNADGTEWKPTPRQMPAGKISVRWRKSSATYVVYVGRKLFESGFGTEKEAWQYVTDNCTQGDAK